MKFHYMSDLHLEFKEHKLKNFDECDGLILAGDIGYPTEKIYFDFLQTASNLFKYVFVIKGNHENYNSDVSTTDENISNVCSNFDNVHYLNNTFFDIPDTNLRVIGTPLWSKIQESQKFIVLSTINDYKLIGGWTLDTHDKEHEKCVNFITNQIEYATFNNKKLIVITHFSPLLDISVAPKYKKSKNSSAFSTDLSQLFNDPIKAWFFGHTHWSMYTEINNVKIMANQKGYNTEVTGFDPMKICIID